MTFVPSALGMKDNDDVFMAQLYDYIIPYSLMGKTILIVGDKIIDTKGGASMKALIEYVLGQTPLFIVAVLALSVTGLALVNNYLMLRKLTKDE